MSETRRAPKPRCLTCMAPVASATSSPLFEADKVIGYKLTYSCHGQTESHEVIASWFKEPGNDRRPFVDEVFPQNEVHHISAEDVANDAFMMKARKSLNEQRAFILATVADLARQQKKTIEVWCEMLLPRLELSVIDLLKEPDDVVIYNLIVGSSVSSRCIGFFELPYLPSGAATWHPVPIPKAGKKAKAK